MFNDLLKEQSIDPLDQPLPNVEGIQHPEELFAQLQRLTKAGIWTIDLGTMEILVSDEMYRLHGVPLGTKVTYDDFIENMCIPEDRHISENARIKVITNKVEEQFDYRAIDQTTGEIKWFTTNVAPILNEEGNVIAFYGTTQDITKTKKEYLERTQKRLATMGETIHLMANQITDPMDRITLSCRDLTKQCEQGELNPETLLSTLDEIETTSLKVSDSLDGVKKVFSDSDLPLKEISLDQLCQSVIDDLAERSTTENVLIKIHELSLSNPKLRTKHSHFIFNIIKELLNNSLDALQERSEAMLKVITLKIANEGIGFSILIEDNGYGIGTDFKEKIFEPYFTTKKTPKGGGMGLYVAKMLANLHLFGDLTQEDSTSGACFKLYIPQLVTQNKI